jgi:chromosome condensin MukBEF complex kleisin-like MukF subunit
MIKINNMEKLKQAEILPEPAKKFLTKILTSNYIDNIKNLDDYIKFINSIGFDLELLQWDDHSIDINIDIDINIYNYVHSSIEARKNKTFADLLYINEEIEEMYKDINMNNNNNNFIILNEINLDDLLDTIKETPFGEMITVNT